MVTSGKSQRPPQRDPRIDSTAPIPRQEEVGRPTRRDATLDLARLRADRAADADDLAAMLVRVADTDRAREAAVQRALGLEQWTLELEAKVAEARTRADDLEVELARVRQAHEQALEAERSRRATELDVLAAEHRAEMTKVHATLEQLEKQEALAASSRLQALEDIRRVLGTPTAPRPDRAVALPGGSIPPSKPLPRRSRKMTAQQPVAKAVQKSVPPKATQPSIAPKATQPSIAPGPLPAAPVEPPQYEDLSLNLDD